MPAHRNLLRIINTYSVPALTVAVIAASVSLHPPADPGFATRSEQVELAATIDTASSAVGVSESSLYFMGQSDLNTAMSELQTMGVTQIRVLLPWEAMEPTDGTYSWAQADQLLNTAAKYGIAVDADITSTPTWASSYSNNGLIPDAQPNASADAAYASFAAAVASRYTSKISAIEVWNEPNGYTGWYPTPNAADYTQLLKDAYSAIKAADPNITVVGGVLGAGISIGTLTINPVTFLQQMYAAGAEGYFDALSFHPYNDTSTFSAGTTFANSAIDQLEALRALMNSNGDAAKLIWATEYGESSADSGGQAQQAAYIQDFLTTWSNLAGVGPMFLYSLLDDSQGDNMGLFTDNWTAKSAVAVVEAWIVAHPAAATAVGAVGSVVTGIGAVVQALSAAVSSLVSGVVSFVQHVVSGIAAAVASFVKALTSGLGSLVGAAASAAPHAGAVAAAATPKAASATLTTGRAVKSVAVAAATAGVTPSGSGIGAGSSSSNPQSGSGTSGDHGKKDKKDHAKPDQPGAAKSQTPAQANTSGRTGHHGTSH
ncbi:MAG: cellulase family glycosylhydrolase [Mycobacterium sp.]